MRVRYTETALRELGEILSYIFERNPSAAAGVADRVQRLAALLEEFPFAGHDTDEAGVRMVPLVRYPFLIFYAVDGEEVVILHVRHAARLRPWEAER